MLRFRCFLKKHHAFPSNQEVTVLNEKERILSLAGEFTWGFSEEFYVETSEGNFIWSDPEYGGNNTLRRTSASYKEWIGPNSVGRDKGKHFIKDYCGEDVTLC